MTWKSFPEFWPLGISNADGVVLKPSPYTPLCDAQSVGTLN